MIYLAPIVFRRGTALMQEAITTPQGWRRAVVRLGLTRAVLAITVFSILSSVFMTAVLIAIMRLHDHVPAMLLIGALVPAAVAPLASHFMVKLLFELESVRENLLQMASRDDLTQVYNRGYFMDHLASEVKRSQRLNSPLSLVMIDADDFKTINDRHGHSVGDQVLREMARESCNALRAYDIFARLGGEEFVALLPSTTLGDAHIVAERVRATIAKLRIATTHDASISITISLGVSSLLPDESDGMKLLDRADALLYEAKRAGRNRVA